MHIDKQIPHLLNGKPTHCNWCSGMLKGLRNIYKGRNCERYYCSQACLSEGEDRAIRYRAQLAGRVCSPWYVGLAAILAVFMLAFTFTGGSRAWAHDPNTHLADGYSSARSKKGTLCCDGTDYTYVNPYSWERTDTGFRVHVKGTWVDIPADAEVGNMKNPDGEAKVWLYEDRGAIGVRCLMPGVES